MNVMDGWIGLWRKMVESTIWEEPLEVRVTFLTLLFMKGPDHIVREPLRVLSKRCNLCPEKVKAYEKMQAALKVLQEPDQHSLDAQEYGGRRIEFREEGIFVLNGAKYDEELREFWARVRRNQAQRARRKGKSVMAGSGPLPGESTAIEHGVDIYEHLEGRGNEAAGVAGETGKGKGSAAKGGVDQVGGKARSVVHRGSGRVPESGTGVFRDSKGQPGDNGGGDQKGSVAGGLDSPVEDAPPAEEEEPQTPFLGNL